ncbi:uncharacterized protein EI97DRAFT_436384 [Westerdykella ornata]|uniref:Uncharacterized protein n=1 Tax=Westerdykella ornata TaxID=318751 RepID=A0A6A6J986_WESOR|nr:uncharacterized protein EI97DRAFT_436384 [Westerdykella ornata]KAF2273140.1 hypothetical protein EI97DRAFT_436384 [Westerdykella ornata]
MVSIFKRSVNVGVGKALEEDLTDLVDCFTVLVNFTGFLEVLYGYFPSAMPLGLHG